MKQMIAILLLFASVNAQAKGLMIATGENSFWGGGILMDPPRRMNNEPHVWETIEWSGERNGARVLWTGHGTYLFPKNDPRLKRLGRRFFGFGEVFECSVTVTTGTVMLFIDGKAVAGRKIDVDEIEFVPNTYDYSKMKIISDTYAQISRLQLKEIDQENIKTMIANATEGMSEQQLSKVHIQTIFEAKYLRNKHHLAFTLAEGRRALGLDPLPDTRNFKRGFIQFGHHFGRDVILLYPQLLLGQSRISDYVLLRPDQVSEDLQRAMHAHGSVAVKATTKLIPGLEEPWVELVNIERRDCAGLLGD